MLGVPENPQISGFISPIMEGDWMELTCKTSGSKPAADIRWFKNDKEVKGIVYLLYNKQLLTNQDILCLSTLSFFLFFILVI